jgi:hypothetical protein
MVILMLTDAVNLQNLSNSIFDKSDTMNKEAIIYFFKLMQKVYIWKCGFSASDYKFLAKAVFRSFSVD